MIIQLFIHEINSQELMEEKKKNKKIFINNRKSKLCTKTDPCLFLREKKLTRIK